MVFLERVRELDRVPVVMAVLVLLAPLMWLISSWVWRSIS